MNIILASDSLYTKSLLHKLGLTFQVDTTAIGVSTKKIKDVSDFVLDTAFKHAQNIYKKNDQKNPKLVIATFSAIQCGKKFFYKPQTAKEALKMLKVLNNKEHTLFNALVLFSNNKIIYKQVNKTIVKFKNISNDVLNKYAISEEALNNVGGYFIQGEGGMFIESIKGSYFNLVGMDLNSLIIALEKLQIKVEDSVKQTIKLQEKSIKESFPR